MPYQYIREPLAAEEADRLANACATPTEQLIVWTPLDTGLRIGELCDLASKDILWQQRQLRVRGKGGPYGKKSMLRVVPMSRHVRALLELPKIRSTERQSIRGSRAGDETAGLFPRDRTDIVRMLSLFDILFF